MSVEFWLVFEAQIRPTRLAINFLLITARAERKVRLCAKLFDFFRGRILIRLTWNLSRFVPYSVEILTWNFRKKLFWENFSEILWNPRLSSTETCAISPYFRQLLFWVRIALKRFTQVLLCVFCTQVRRHVHKRIKKGDTGKKIQDVLFSENQFCSLSVWDLLRLTPWVFWCEIFTRRSSLCLMSFGWGLSPRFVPQDWQ